MRLETEWISSSETIFTTVYRRISLTAVLVFGTISFNLTNQRNWYSGSCTVTFVLLLVHYYTSASKLGLNNLAPIINGPGECRGTTIIIIIIIIIII